MKVPFHPFPEDVPPMRPAKFLRLLETKQGFAEKMEAHYNAQLALPHTLDTAEMHVTARAAKRVLQHHMGVWKTRITLRQAEKVVHKGAGGAEPIPLLRSLLAEATHQMLHTHDPEHAELAAHIAKLRLILDSLPPSI